MKNARTQTNWFRILNSNSQNETDLYLPSRLEIVFLLGSRAPISVLDIPADMTITQLFSVCDHDQHDTSIMMTIGH